MVLGLRLGALRSVRQLVVRSIRSFVMRLSEMFDSWIRFHLELQHFTELRDGYTAWWHFPYSFNLIFLQHIFFSIDSEDRTRH